MWQPGRFVLGQGRRGGIHQLSDGAGFLKTKICLPIIHRLTDDHVIKHLNLENPGSFVKPASQTKIGFARARVSAYAAYGISGVIPHPVLCRMATGFSKSGQRPDAA